MYPYSQLVEQLLKQAEAFAGVAEPIRLSMVRMHEQLQPVRDIVQRLIEPCGRLKENYSKAQKYLFAEGWYLGGDMPLSSYSNLADMVEEARHKDIEEAMCGWARSQMVEIIDETCKVFPDRSQLIRDAANAHVETKYSLSIPVLLAQSDGIANEIIGNCLFRGTPQKSLEKKLAQFGVFKLTPIFNMLLDPLRSWSCFFTCSPEHPSLAGLRLVNRSEVMHGAQLDYASEANSLRCIMLLGYLKEVKCFLESHSEQAAEFREAIDNCRSVSESEVPSDADYAK